MARPIRVFYSALSRRFYATRAYREGGNGLVTVTGEKFDVTNDIASLIAEHNIEFREKPSLDPRNPDYSRPGIFATHNCARCRDGTDLSRCPTPGRPGNCGYAHARND